MRLSLKSTGFIVVLSLLIVVALVGCGSSPSKGTSNSTSEGNITGKVVAPSNVTFKHLEKMVFLETLTGTVAVSGAICTIEGTDKSAITDDQGSYTITDISAGSYIVICRKTASDGQVFAFLKIAEVQAGETTDIGTIQVRQTGNIQGKATLANQTDHTGITVYTPGTSMQAQTDAIGGYLIKNIPEGPYNLLFEKDGYVTASLDVIVASGETTVANDLSLSLSTGASGSLMIEDGKVYSNSRTVTVSIDASEEAVLYQISENPNFIGSIWNPVPSSRSWIFDSDGDKRLYAKFADANGLESAPVSDSIIIDTTPPANGSIIINNSASVTNSTTVTLTLSATDATTAVSQRKVSNNPDFTDALWGTFISQVFWTIPSGDGNKTVYVKFRDVVGNETGTVSASIILDTARPASPSIRIQEGAYTHNTQIHLNLFASDASLVKISEDPNFSGATPVPYATDLTWILSSGDGNKTIYAKYIDDASNETSPVSTSIILDTTSPTTPVIFNKDQTTNQTTFEMKLGAGSSDTNFSNYQLKGGQFPDWTDTTETTAFNYTLTQQGQNTLSIRGKDMAGNVGTAASVTVSLDTVKPILSDIRVSPTDTTATIVWQTNEPTTAQVDFGLNQDYGSTQTDNNLTTSHTVLLSGLSSRTLYHYTITSIDAVNNTTASTDLIFMTQPTFMPTARYGLGVGVVNGILYAVGGIGKNGILGTVEAYDPVTNIWTTNAPMSTIVGGDLEVGVVNGILYAAGDSGFEAYDPTTNTWETKAPIPAPPYGLSDMGVGVVNGILYAVGGHNNEHRRYQIFNTIQAYDPATNSWTAKAPMPTARFAPGVGVVNGILYVVGGYGNNGPLEIVEAYDPATNTWTMKAPMPTQQYGLGIGVINGILYAVGGSDSNGTLAVNAYDPVTNTWTTKTPMPTARSRLAVGVVNGILYSVGGKDMNGDYLVLPTVETFIP